MTISGAGAIPGGEITIDASKSSQFLSALLLIGPSMVNGITVTHQGGELPSMPHIDMTVAMLRDFGATVTVDRAAQKWSVAPGDLRGVDLVIEPDLSNAAPFLSLAMVCGGRSIWLISTSNIRDRFNCCSPSRSHLDPRLQYFRALTTSESQPREVSER